MASTSAEVCNLALLKVGQRQTIDSLDENTEQAMACKALFAHNRDLVLEAANWTFSTRRSVLALTTEARSGWTYAYALPTGCKTPLYLWTGVRNPAHENQLPFACELNDAGDARILLTDKAEAELVYTVGITNISLFSDNFVEALACKLAMELVRAIPVKPQFAASLQQEYALALARAVAHDRSGATPDVEPEGSSVRVRQ